MNTSIAFPLAELFQGEQYYNNHALIICGSLFFAGILLLALTPRSFSRWIDADVMPSVAKRMFWRRATLICGIFFGLSLAFWIFRGPIGSKLMPMGDTSLIAP